jgi:hypothetical protein
MVLHLKKTALAVDFPPEQLQVVTVLEKHLACQYLLIALDDLDLICQIHRL